MRVEFVTSLVNFVCPDGLNHHFSHFSLYPLTSLVFITDLQPNSTLCSHFPAWTEALPWTSGCLAWILMLLCWHNAFSQGTPRVPLQPWQPCSRGGIVSFTFAQSHLSSSSPQALVLRFHQASSLNPPQIKQDMDKPRLGLTFLICSPERVAAGDF